MKSKRTKIRQLNKMRKTTHEQNEKFNKETETIKKQNRNSGAKEYNDRTEKLNRNSTINLIMQKNQRT